MKRNWFPVLLVIIVIFVIAHKMMEGNAKAKKADQAFAAYKAPERIDRVWRGRKKSQIPTDNGKGRLILYGHDLISNTSYYLGPKGTIAHTTNGMNCQNCHLDGGTIPFGNNFGKVYSTYPQFRARSNGVQSIYARINDCFERSLNGKALDSNTHEMQAIYAYMQWLDEDIPKGEAKGGTSLMKLPYMHHPAEAAAGRRVYVSNCQSCHGATGKGQINAESNGYLYPPLWGEHSYNDGAGLFRLGSFAGFVKNNMPFGTDYHAPKLTDEEAWNVAAFENSQPRPHKDQRADWRNISKKPVDFPFGPYADSFTEREHKYGPFTAMSTGSKTK